MQIQSTQSYAQPSECTVVTHQKKPQKDKLVLTIEQNFPFIMKVVFMFWDTPVSRLSSVALSDLKLLQAC